MRVAQRNFIKAAFFISFPISGLLSLAAAADLSAQQTPCPDIILLPDEFCIKVGAKYFIVNKDVAVNRHTAHRACRRRGFMADFQNEMEFDALSNALDSMGLLDGHHIFWIGANDLGSEGAFKSDVTGAPVTFERWVAGEPNNFGDNEHCVVLWKMHNQIGMNDDTCESNHQYICQVVELNE